MAQDHGQDSSNNKTEQQDYSKNKTYQQGVREGRNDHARNLDHSKKRHFKKDEDQKAYESGYQQGHDGK
jgi:ribosome modulation factor